MPEAENSSHSQNATNLIAETIQSQLEPVSILALGPLTNLAEMIQAGTLLKEEVQQVVIMGGAVDVPGNIASSGMGSNWQAEWIFFVDPLAVKVVLESGLPIILVLLDATNQVVLDQIFYRWLAQNHNTHAAEFVFNFISSNVSRVLSGNYFFWDPLAAGILVDPTLAEYESRILSVITVTRPDQGDLVTMETGLPVRFAHHRSPTLLPGFSHGFEPTIMNRNSQFFTSAFLWFQIARIAVISLILVTLLVYIVVLPVSHEGFEWTNSLANAVYALRFTISRSALSMTIIFLSYLGLIFCLLSGLMLYLLRVLRSKQTDWISLLASLMFILLPIFFISPQYDLFPDLWGMPIEPIYGFLTFLAILFFVDFGFLFPDGRLFPVAIRVPFFMTNLGSCLIVFGGIIFQNTSPEIIDAFFIFLVIFLAFIFISMIFSQFYRYQKGSTTLQRQQTKLVLLGLLSWPVYTFFIRSGLLSIPPAYYALLTLVLQTVVITLLPVTVIISIYRYRLWDIDLVIRRSFIYGALSLTLITIYIFSILLFQRILTAISGQNSNLGLVLSPLLIAAIFTPLRKRIQSDIDRRFFRSKYDADKIISEFSSTARKNVSLEEINQEIVTIIDKTMQPEFTSIWFIKKK